MHNLSKIDPNLVQILSKIDKNRGAGAVSIFDAKGGTATLFLEAILVQNPLKNDVPKTLKKRMSKIKDFLSFRLQK